MSEFSRSIRVRRACSSAYVMLVDMAVRMRYSRLGLAILLYLFSAFCFWHLSGCALREIEG